MELVEEALAAVEQDVEVVAAARFGDLDEPVEELLALGELDHLIVEDLGDRLVDEQADQALGVEHRVGEVALGVPVMAQLVGPLVQRALAHQVEDAVAVLVLLVGLDLGAELLEDEKKFIDLANSPLWFGREYEIVG